MRDASVIALLKDKKLLLQKRDAKAPFAKNQWGFFGGGIDEGESLMEALQREISEELSYTVKDAKQVGSFPMAQEGVKGIVHLFVANYDATQTLNQHEGADMAWLAFNDTQELPLMDVARDMVTFLKEKEYIE